MLPVAEATGSTALQLVDRNHCAVPVKPAVCVPAASRIERVALFAPVVCVVSGLNCTVAVQLAPGARVVWPASCPPPAGPQVDNSRTMVNSVGLVPVSVAWLGTFKGTFPLLVREKI